MRRVLVDAGPMIAVYDDDDPHHRECLRVLPTLPSPLITVWPAITEAMHLLGHLPPAQDALLEMIVNRKIIPTSLDSDDAPRLRELLRKYRDRPMDLADAALVRVAERDDIDTVFTIDRSDFEVYRRHGRRRFTIVP